MVFFWSAGKMLKFEQKCEANRFGLKYMTKGNCYKLRNENDNEMDTE